MVRAFLIYGLGGAASRLAAVFLVPLYTRAFSVDEYGLLELLLALQVGATLLSGLQSESAILRDYFAAEGPEQRRRLVWNGLLISLCGGVAIVACAMIASGTVAAMQDIAPYLAPMLVLTILAQVVGIQLIVIRCREQATRFSLLAVLDLSLSAVASIVFILVFEMGIGGALLGMICGKLATSAIAFRSTFGRPPRPLMDRGLAWRMLAYAVPTLPAVMFNWAQTNGTRVLLGAFFSLQDVAVAGVAIRVAALFGFVVQSFRLAWEPYAFRKLDEVAVEHAVYDRALQVYSLTMFCAVALAMLAAPVLVAIFAPAAYSVSTPLVGLFVAGQFWLGATSITTMGIHGARVTGKLTTVFGVGALLNAFVLLLFAPAIGILAAALGFLASTFVCAAVSAWLSNRHYRTGLNIGRMTATFATTLVAGMACWAISRAVVLGAFDAHDFLLRSAALAAVLTLLAGILMAITDRSTRVDLASRSKRSYQAIALRGFRRPEV